MIYKLDSKPDITINKLGDIWLNSNIKSHNFIDKSYWINNYENVLEAFKDSEIIVYKSEGEILGFCGLTDDYIAGMFVEENERGKGVGKDLMQYIQNDKDTLFLNVYKNNSKAIYFYKNHNFKIVDENTDETGNKEYKMNWTK